MTYFFNTLPETNLGYSAIFFFMALGFLFLKAIDKDEIGPGYWAIAFVCNAIGFVFWSGVIPINQLLYYFLGEVFHISGFIIMVCGAYRFTGNSYKFWNIIFIIVWLIVWLIGLIFQKYNSFISSLILKSVRSVLFITGGVILIKGRRIKKIDGHILAGWSLISWGLYLIVYAFVRIDKGLSFFYGILVGFQILSAFGMIVMVIESIKKRADLNEKRVEKLEGLLPICSYCKKIRDENGKWNILELYIEDRSKAEFSHGICPDCMKKHYSDIYNK